MDFDFYGPHAVRQKSNSASTDRVSSRLFDRLPARPRLKLGRAGHGRPGRQDREGVRRHVAGGGGHARHAVGDARGGTGRGAGDGVAGGGEGRGHLRGEAGGQGPGIDQVSHPNIYRKPSTVLCKCQRRRGDASQDYHFENCDALTGLFSFR